MPTTRLRTVKSSGGDYSTLSGWEAGEAADLVTLDEIRVAECYSMTDTTAVTINGFITDTTRYLEIRTPTSERHPGWWTGSTYILSVSNNGCININDDHVRLVGLRIEISESGATARNAVAVGSVGTALIYIEQCLIRQAPGSSGTGLLRGIRGEDSTATLRISNTICYDFRQGSAVGFACNSGNFFLYHCGAHNCDLGFERTAGGCVPKNCWAQDCTDGFSGSWTSATDNCSDIASDAPGTNPVTGSILFVDEANDDFHLSASDTVAVGAGIDLSADADYPIGVDIDGLAYASWSGINIGPDQFASGGGPTTYHVELAATMALVAALSRVARWRRALTASTTLSASIAKVQAYRRTLAASSAMTATLARAGAFRRALSASLSVGATLSRATTFRRTLSASLAASATVTQARKYFRSLTVAMPGQASLAFRMAWRRALTVSMPAVASLSRHLTLKRTLSVTMPAVVTLAKRLVLHKTLTAAVTGAVSLSAYRKYYRTLSASFAGLASLVQVKVAAALVGVRTMFHLGRRRS